MNTLTPTKIVTAVDVAISPEASGRKDVLAAMVAPLKGQPASEASEILSCLGMEPKPDAFFPELYSIWQKRSQKRTVQVALTLGPPEKEQAA